MLIVATLVGFKFHEGLAEALLAFVIVVAVGYATTWVAAFAGLSLKTVEAVQAAMFTIVFPIVFVSSVFVPIESFPTWLQGIASVNPVTIWADTVRLLVLGDAYTAWRASIGDPISSLGSQLLLSTLWGLGILAVFSYFGVRVYRRT